MSQSNDHAVAPATYMMETSRGVILRSAGLPELWTKALKLFASGVVILLIAYPYQKLHRRKLTHVARQKSSRL